MEFWLKEKNAGNADEVERQMNELIERFDERERKILSDRQQVTAMSMATTVEVTITSTQATTAISDFLNEAQIRRLAADKITSLEQLREMSVEELENYRMTMDQIYSIKSKRLKAEGDPVCVEKSNGSAVNAIDVVPETQDTRIDEAIVDFPTDNGDKNETQSPNAVNPVNEKPIENETDGSDSDGEDRLVINDELLI